MLALSFVIVLCLNVSFAANNLIGLKDVTYEENEKYEKITVSFTGNVGETIEKRLDSPKRLLVDFSQSELVLKKRNVEVNSKTIRQIRLGQFTPTTARIVLDLNRDIKYEVSKNGTYYSISIPKPVEIEKEGINNNSSKEQSAKKTDKGSKQEQLIDVKTKKEEKDKIEVISNKDNNDNQTKVINMEPNKTKEQQTVMNKIAIEYKKIDIDEVAKIKVANYKGYNVFRIKNPDRIVIDIPNAYFEEGNNKIRINGEFIKLIRHSNFTKTSARIILDVLKNPNYDISEESDGIKITVKRNANYSTQVGKVNYIKSGDRVWLKINKTGFTDRQGNNIANYTERYNSAKKIYTIVFDKDIANLNDEVLEIDDNYLKKIEVINNKQTQKTKIVFWAKDDFAYNIMSREKAGDTAITILKRATKKQNVVVIDAGHGGPEEPGSMCDLFYEKHLNLDIALRLEECLKKKNINTYMIRKSDVYVSVYERANIANKLNASLFVSIHNNSFGQEANGTETLYNPNNKDENINIQSKKMASIVQNNLIKALGTRDRGIKERPNLIVLKHTTMPSVLTEIGFLTNPKELELLNDNNFRQKAAQAIADAIEEMIKSL